MADFEKIFASNSPLPPYEWPDSDYLQGWNSVGSAPPTRGQFDAIQRLNDEKMLQLKREIAESGLNLLRRVKVYEEGDIAFSANLPSWAFLECIVGGTTAILEPSLSGVVEKDEIIDGTVTWKVCRIGKGTSGGKSVGEIVLRAWGEANVGELMCNGAEISRAMYPDYAQWCAEHNYPWGAGDGVTTVNLPNLIGRFPEGAASAGGYHEPGLPNIEGSVGFFAGRPLLAADGAFYVDDRLSDARAVTGEASYSNSTGFSLDATRSNPIYGRSTTVQPPSALLIPYVVVFTDQTADSALIDVTQYAQDLAQKANRSLSNLTTEGQAKLGYGNNDFTIIYPNGGTAESPANVAVNSRYVIDNPFDGYYVTCVAEVLYNGEWGNPEWYSDLNSNIGRGAGVRANQCGNKIVVQTGTTYVLPVSRISGNPLNVTTAVTTALPCRVKVWKVGKV